VGDVENMICPAFARALTEGRTRYNTLFSQARRGSTRLDGTAFLEFLRRSVDPIIAAVAAVELKQVSGVLDVLYELALDLVAKGVLGDQAGSPEVDRIWPDLLSGVANHLARAPRQLAAPLTNALYNLTTRPGCKPELWCKTLRSLIPVCVDAKMLLQAGQVAGWRCGMAHFRSAALDLAGTLPADVVRLALALPGDAEVSAMLARLIDDPWFDPLAPAPGRGLRRVAVVGAFRGFGGVFVRPPRVAFRDGCFYAFDGVSSWIVAADAFGATFHRDGQALPEDASSKVYVIDAKGRARGRGFEQSFPELAGATSSAGSMTTLAVTLPCSHSVYLVSGGIQ
jgi:hypothetical protein